MPNGYGTDQNIFDQVGMIVPPPLSLAGTGRIYFDATDNTFKVSQNGGAFANLVGGTPPGAMSAFRAVTNANINIADNTITDVICDIEQQDLGGNYDPVTGVFTSTIKGLYQFNGLVGIQTMTPPVIQALLTLTSSANATLLEGNQVTTYSGADVYLLLAGLVLLDVGDTAKLRAFQNSSSAAVALARFSGFLVAEVA